MNTIGYFLNNPVAKSASISKKMPLLLSPAKSSVAVIIQFSFVTKCVYFYLGRTQKVDLCGKE